MLKRPPDEIIGALIENRNDNTGLPSESKATSAGLFPRIESVVEYGPVIHLRLENQESSLIQLLRIQLITVGQRPSVVWDRRLA